MNTNLPIEISNFSEYSQLIDLQRLKKKMNTRKSDQLVIETE